jgi:hypothetical protein
MGNAYVQEQLEGLYSLSLNIVMSQDLELKFIGRRIAQEYDFEGGLVLRFYGLVSFPTIILG